MVHRYCHLFTNRSNRILPFEEFNMLGILSSEGIAQSCGIFWNDTFHRSPPLVALLQKIPEEKNNHPTQKISIFNIFLWGFGKFTIPYIIPSHLTKYITNPEYSPKCQHLKMWIYIFMKAELRRVPNMWKESKDAFSFFFEKSTWK